MVLTMLNHPEITFKTGLFFGAVRAIFFFEKNIKSLRLANGKFTK